MYLQSSFYFQEYQVKNIAVYFFHVTFFFPYMSVYSIAGSYPYLRLARIQNRKSHCSSQPSESNHVHGGSTLVSHTMHRNGKLWKQGERKKKEREIDTAISIAAGRGDLGHKQEEFRASSPSRSFQVPRLFRVSLAISVQISWPLKGRENIRKHLQYTWASDSKQLFTGTENAAMKTGLPFVWESWFLPENRPASIWFMKWLLLLLLFQLFNLGGYTCPYSTESLMFPLSLCECKIFLFWTRWE